MPAWPDASRVASFLAQARRRFAVVAAMWGAAVGLGLAAIVAAIAWIGGGRTGTALTVGIALTLLATVIALLVERRGARASLRVEARAPHCRNLLVTADEILQQPDCVRPYIGARVCQDAARVADAVDLRAILPLRRPVIALLATSALATAASVAAIARAPVPAAIAAGIFESGAVIRGVDITVTPPAYSGRPPVRLEDPERLTALAGSRIDVVVRGRVESGAIETTDGRASLAPSTDGTLSGSVVAQQDGFLAIDARRGALDDRRLIGLTVTPDAPPVVRLIQPGRDLVFTDGVQTIAIEASAVDDLALASLRIVYTKVTGSGENFTFADGEVPLTTTRASDTRWSATASWALAPLALAPGDMVVYRAVARDRRPDAPAAESDAFIVEILAPTSVAAEGFAIDDEHDRYAISQQMVILKTERLIARRSSLTKEALLEQSMLLAAEQRQVRAEFVFMMGGHIEDEEVEAAGEHEVAEGRLENRGRVDLVQAIRAMSEAGASLNDGDLTTGLGHEKQALAALQRAFTRSRYILRTLAERERLETSRRLSGDLSEAASAARQPPAVPVSPRVDVLARAITEVAALSGRSDLGRAHAANVDALAADLLRVDPASEAWRSIAATLDRVSAALRQNDTPAARAALEGAASALAAALRGELAAAGAAPDAARDRMLGGALADALRRGGSR
jgi:hypothetical protein